MTHSFGNIVLAFFKDYLADIRGLSENSIASYSDCMRLLFSFAANKLNKKSVEYLEIEDITDNLIIEFLNYLEAKRKNKRKTRNQRLAIIKTFFSFIAGKCPELIHVAEKITAISAKKEETKLVEPLTPEELKLFFDGIDVSKGNGLRDLALFRFMYNTGARVSEIVNLKVSDIKLEGPYQVKLNGKGNKTRIICLFPETVEVIQDYLKQRDEKNISGNYLFLNKYEEQMARQGINYLVSKYAKIAGEKNSEIKRKKISPHTFRHTTAFHMIKAQVDIVTLKDWLGHEDINTTSQYVQIDNQMREESIKKINPFKGRKIKAKWKLPKILELLKNLSRLKPVLCKEAKVRE
jgi:site-specific recombinase XerD